MGNSDFLGYTMGAYNHLEDKKRKDAELMAEEEQRQMKMEIARRSMADDEVTRGRNNIKWDRDQEEYAREKGERDKLDESKYLGPLIKPFVPDLDRSVPGKSTMVAPLPSQFMGGMMSAAGGVSLPENMLPGEVKTEDFLTGDEQSFLTKERLKRADDDDQIAYEVRKRQAMQDAGVGYNGRSGGKGLGAKAASSSPISAPGIVPFFKNVQAVNASGDAAAINFLDAKVAAIKAQNPDLPLSQAQTRALTELNSEMTKNAPAPAKKTAAGPDVPAAGGRKILAPEERAKKEQTIQPTKTDEDADRLLEDEFGLTTRTKNMAGAQGAGIAAPQILPLPAQAAPQGSGIQPFNGSTGKFGDSETPQPPVPTSNVGVFNRPLEELEGRKQQLQQELMQLESFLSPSSDPSNSFRRADAAMSPVEKQNAIMRRDALISAIEKLDQTISPMQLNGQMNLPGLASEVGSLLLPGNVRERVSPADRYYQNIRLGR